MLSMPGDVISNLLQRIEKLEATVAILADPWRSRAINIAGDAISQSIPDIPLSGAAQAAAAQAAREGAAVAYDTLGRSGEISFEEYAGYYIYGDEHGLAIPTIVQPGYVEYSAALGAQMQFEPGRFQGLSEQEIVIAFAEGVQGQLSQFSESSEFSEWAAFAANSQHSLDAAKQELGRAFLRWKWGTEGAELIQRLLLTVPAGEASINMLRNVSFVADDLSNLNPLLQTLAALDPNISADYFGLLVQNPGLASLLSSSASVDQSDGLYADVLATPELIPELVASPLLSQVLHEISNEEEFQNALIMELFGDIGEESPIALALNQAVAAALTLEDDDGTGGALRGALRTILEGTEGEAGLLAEMLQSALMSGEGGESPLLGALREAIVNALLGGEEGESPLAQMFNDAIGSVLDEETPLGTAVGDAREEIERITDESTNTAVLTIESTRDDGLAALRRERAHAISIIIIEREKALAMLRGGGGGGPDPADFQTEAHLAEIP